MRGIRDWAGRLIISVAAGALLILGLATLPAHAAPRAVVQPKDALTLVRQALAALEVTPPAVSVATVKVLNALFAQDTRGVDMARVQEAAQALGQEDSATAAALLIAALPARGGPDGGDEALLTAVRPRFSPTPGAYSLLVGAVLLLAAGGLIIRR